MHLFIMNKPVYEIIFFDIVNFQKLLVAMFYHPDFEINCNFIEYILYMVML